MSTREDGMIQGTGTGGCTTTPKRTKRGSRPCGLCGSHADRLLRIKSQEDGPWFIACPICAARVSEDNPHFAYGGRIARRPVRRASA